MLNDTFFQGIVTSYGVYADEVFQAYQGLFAALPLAVRTPNRVFLCHTIPDPPDLDRFDPAIFAAETWSYDAMKRGGPVYAITWGRTTDPENADRFAEIVDADWFVTGHQPCDDGFRQANPRQIIIDGTNPYPAGCLFPTREPVTIDRLLEGIRIFPTG